jgi:hypothetical protein
MNNFIKITNKHFKKSFSVNTSVGYDKFAGSTRECNHLVTPNLWPFCTYEIVFALVTIIVSYFYKDLGSLSLFFFFITVTLISIFGDFVLSKKKCTRLKKSVYNS